MELSVVLPLMLLPVALYTKTIIEDFCKKETISQTPRHLVDFGRSQDWVIKGDVEQLVWCK